MESLKIDRTKLKTVKSYAELRGMTVQRIYQLINEGEIKTTRIDGIIFIDLS